MKHIALIFFLNLALVAAAAAQLVPVPPEPWTFEGGVSYGLVIDNSGSYRTLLDKVIELVSDIVEENKAGDEAFLVTFVDSSKIAVRQDMTGNSSDLRDAAENMFIEGGLTSILDAVKFSADHLAAKSTPGFNRSKVLILISDGDERKSFASFQDVIKSLKAENIKVFVIALAEDKVYTKVIDRLSKETGGTKYTPKTRDEIRAAGKSLSAAIRAK